MLKTLRRPPSWIESIDTPLLSGFVHRLTSLKLFFENSLRGSKTESITIHPGTRQREGGLRRDANVEHTQISRQADAALGDEFIVKWTGPPLQGLSTVQRCAALDQRLAIYSFQAISSCIAERAICKRQAIWCLKYASAAPSSL